MKINRKQWLTGVALGLGMIMAGSASAASISTTKHNLGSTGTGNALSAGTGEICVFCHTPHAAASANAPLWNKNLPAAGGAVGGGAYTLYTSSTMQASSNLGSATTISHACLSCHDGTQAMDNIVNAPTTGTGVGTNHQYDATGGGVTGRAWAWSAANVGDEVMDVDGYLVGGGATGSIAMLGSDLSNDHPVGIAYGGGSADYATDGALTTDDPDFVAGANYQVSGTNYWIDTSTGTAGTRDKTDMILFMSGTNAQVECASCHDVHDNTNVPFLRMTNTGSALCLACHTK